MMTTGALLRSKTADLHAATELVMEVAGIRSASLSPEAYTRMMMMHYRVWRAVAEWLPPSIPARDRSFVGDMLAAIGRDLGTLGEALPPSLDFVHSDKSKASCFGVMYVLRGSTLGATMINRKLRDCPELNHLNDFNFHAACEALPPRHWPNFLKELEAEVDDEEGRGLALAAGRGVFGLYLG